MKTCSGDEDDRVPDVGASGPKVVDRVLLIGETEGDRAHDQSILGQVEDLAHGRRLHGDGCLRNARDPEIVCGVDQVRDVATAIDRPVEALLGVGGDDCVPGGLGDRSGFHLPVVQRLLRCGALIVAIWF